MPDVEDLCMSKLSCRLDVTQQYLDTGNCKGFSDYMFIEYKCVQGKGNNKIIYKDQVLKSLLKLITI